MNRRTVLKSAFLAAGIPFINKIGFANTMVSNGKFRFCLNTSTISGQQSGIKKYIEIAAKAGYDCVEIWIRDLVDYLKAGGNLASLSRLLKDSHISVANAIGFAPWMSLDEAAKKEGFKQMREEMEMVKALGSPRIAAPVVGINDSSKIDMFMVGERFKELLALGRETGVAPQLEFWGSSPVFYHIGQAMMAVSVANDAGCRILPDVYHLFRGNSGFESLKMIDGSLIEIIHMNDYPGSVPRDKLTDSDRVYPGDGIAPLHNILTDLNKMKGEKILSLELFNEGYWKQDPLLVAQTGLSKMKKLVNAL